MKTIWILGAGASKSNNNNFPLINDFFNYAKIKNITAKATKTLNPEYLQTGNYIKDNFGKNILLKSEKIDIEEILTCLDIDLHKKPHRELSSIRNNIINLIRRILAKESNQTNPKSEYSYFNKCIEDTIITFNWDVLLDNILDREKILNRKYHVKEGDNGNQYYNMVSDISAIGEFTYARMSVELPYSVYNPSNKGYLLKMHGSIDWVYCKNESCRGFNKVFPVYDIFNELYCSECNEHTEFLIVPPVLNKQYDTYPIIRRIWNKAVVELSIASNIIIWGYSLPPTDFYSNWLLRQCNKNLNKVIIINPALIRKRNYGGNWVYNWNRNFTKPFIDIFKNKIEKNKIEYYEYFKDYINRREITKKYPIKPI